MKSLIAFALLCAAAGAFADAPFEMPNIAEPTFADKDISIVDFGAKDGVKATEAFAAAMAGERTLDIRLHRRAGGVCAAGILGTHVQPKDAAALCASCVLSDGCACMSLW